MYEIDITRVLMALSAVKGLTKHYCMIWQSRPAYISGQDTLTALAREGLAM
jgi:hypothetical protein